MPLFKEMLPYIDEHLAVVDAGPTATWEALQRVVERSFARVGRTSRLLGCAETVASGPRPLATGSTLPGFRVEAAEPAAELALAGSHRFSDYALVFRLAGGANGQTTLRAETRAAFPGVKGRAYRSLVIGTRIHVLVTRRLLATTKRAAEKSGTDV